MWLCLADLLPLLYCNIYAQSNVEKYTVDSASIEQKGVPKGEILKFIFYSSVTFPGTWREVWVYIPSQYKPQIPACVYINQDGIQWNAPTVFDNLIHRQEMPVTIGVFIRPGIVKSKNETQALDRYNRSFEYDGMGDAYAKFVLNEILPAVEKLKTTDGRFIRLSKNGDDRAIGGRSSGAVCSGRGIQPAWAGRHRRAWAGATLPRPLPSAPAHPHAAWLAS